MIAPELRSLLQGCKDAPDDDTPRLVLADWLEEHGEADRAEFVRLSVRLAAGEIPLGDEAVSLARLHELYARNADKWLGGLRDWTGRLVFKRGLIEARCDVTQLRQLDAATPPDVVPWLETLVFNYAQQKRIADLLETSALSRFSGLELTTVRVTPPWLKRVANDPLVASLRRLRVGVNRTGSGVPIGKTLARGSKLAGLRALDASEGLPDGALAALAEAPWLAGLSSFISAGWFGKAVTTLARSQHVPRPARIDWQNVDLSKGRLQQVIDSPLTEQLVDLRLSNAGIRKEEAAAFASGLWPRLRSLSLERNPLYEPGIRALAQARFSALRSLDLRWASIDPPALRALLSCPWVGQLERLELSGTFGDEEARLLAECDALAGLWHLELVGIRIGPAGVSALLNSRKMTALQTLELTSSIDCDPAGRRDGLPSLTALTLHVKKMTADGVRALAASSLASRLRHLDLSRSGLEPEACAALAVPAFAGLRSLELSSSNVGKAGAAALAKGPFRDLVRLGLNGCELGDSGVKALLRPDAFPSLSILELASNKLKSSSATTLRNWPRLPRMAWVSAALPSEDDSLLARLADPVAFRRWLY
jgi:uncharacterized protein (TIGR02996 family)